MLWQIRRDTIKIQWIDPSSDQAVDAVIKEDDTHYCSFIFYLIN